MNLRKKIMLICGSRPEVIKLTPLYRLLKKHPFFSVTLILTGQHPDLIPPLLKALNIECDETLPLNWQRYSDTDLLEKFKEILLPIIKKISPDLIIVQGDTTSALYAAMIGTKMGIAIGHIEAGLRTYDLHAPFPEEINRQNISKISQWHFCPTQEAYDNLKEEGIDPKTLFITGNSSIDILKTTLAKIPKKIQKRKKPYILITLHRRESHGSPLLSILKTITHIAREHPQFDYILPVHPNPTVYNAVHHHLKNIPNIFLTEPYAYPDFIEMMKNAFFIMSDSGGIQEEAPFLNIPLLVLRDKTERMEAVRTGAIKLAGTTHHQILKEVSLLIHDEKHYKEICRAKNPFGNGQASHKIISILNDIL